MDTTLLTKASEQLVLARELRIGQRIRASWAAGEPAEKPTLETHANEVAAAGAKKLSVSPLQPPTTIWRFLAERSA